MRIKSLNNTAFTLLEVLLATIIFIVTIGGVFLTLNAIRGPVLNKENALLAAVFGKQVLEVLRSQVSAQSFYSPTNYACSGSGSGIACTDFSLALGAHQVPSSVVSSAGLSWPPALETPDNFVAGCSQNATDPCLVYNVKCGDGSTPSSDNPPDCINSSSGSNDIARRVDLFINYQDAL